MPEQLTLLPVFFGYDQGVFGGILQNPHWLATFNYPTPVITGITVSSYCLGALTGCITTFFIGDILGRRRMIWLSMTFIIVGASLQASAYSLPHLIVGRVITGIGTGMDSSTVPMYQSELCKAEWRGRIVAWEIWFIGIGIVLAYWIDYAFSYVAGEAGWRTPIALQLIFAVAVVFIVWGLPESPRWLAKRGREEEAAQVLCDVFDLQRHDPYVLGEMDAIRAAIAIETGEGAGKALSIFKKGQAADAMAGVPCLVRIVHESVVGSVFLNTWLQRFDVQVLTDLTSQVSTSSSTTCPLCLSSTSA